MKYLTLLARVWLGAALVVPAAAEAQTIAITGGTVHPVGAPRIDNGTVLIRDGRIVAIGTDVQVPAGARRIDARGKVVTPGLIHASSELGLLEVSSIDETNERVSEGEVTASFDVAEGIDPRSVRIPVARTEGVTAAMAVPTGGIFAGQAALIALSGSRMEAMLRVRDAAMAGNFGDALKAAGGGSHAAGLARVRRILEDARDYDRRRADYRRADMQELSAPASELEALLPVLRGTMPLYVVANSERDILNAVRLAKEFGIRLIVRGGTEAWKVTTELAEAKVPVAVDAYANIPDFENMEVRWDNAALLAEAGVTLLIYEGSDGGPRNLRFAAGHAVRNGLPWSTALEAITLAPARVFGADTTMGSLAAGRRADVVVWSGDPFEFSTRPEHVIIGGEEIPLTSRQTELLERYRTLPPAH
ncbi:MAG TPA: amidohydrolase family protein [Gemmatimonadales bacterium]|nr:amidohydrolase family protein [Gemmatimonadales bacterium]